MGEHGKYKRRVFGTRPPIVSIRKPLSTLITACRCPTFWPVLPAREVEPLDLTVVGVEERDAALSLVIGAIFGGVHFGPKLLIKIGEELTTRMSLFDWAWPSLYSGLNESHVVFRFHFAIRLFPV